MLSCLLAARAAVTTDFLCCCPKQNLTSQALLFWKTFLIYNNPHAFFHRRQWSFLSTALGEEEQRSCKSLPILPLHTDSSNGHLPSSSISGQLRIPHHTPRFVLGAVQTQRDYPICKMFILLIISVNLEFLSCFRSFILTGISLVTQRAVWRTTRCVWNTKILLAF